MADTIQARVAGEGRARRMRRVQRPGLLEAAGAIWLLIVTVFFLWQAVTYRGVIAILGEWQFDWTGRYYPTLTCLLLMLFFSLPGLVALHEADRDRRRRSLTRKAWRNSATARALLAIAAGFACTALGALLLTARLPSDRGQPLMLRADAPVAAPLREGPAVLAGQIDYQRTAALEEDVWAARRNSLFAPIGVTGENQRVRYFVELDRSARADPAHPIELRRGILKQDALPGELVRLYRYAGLTIERPYYVLYADRDTLRWPYVAIAGELGIVALVLALAGILAAPPRDMDSERG